ncbi:MAG: hypothetical protein WD342_03945 [Verrucomicrobiales bacterium]
MVDRIRTPLDRPGFVSGRTSCFGFAVAGFLAAAFAAVPGALVGQTPAAASTPVDPAAAAGMTSGMSEADTYRQLELMQVRAAAQGAQGDAAAASVSRSADRTVEEQNRQKAIEAAREVKALKRDAANRMRWERASNAYNKVSRDDMSTWKTETGSVRVERNVPDPFLIALIQEEERAIAEAAARGEDTGGFSPLQATKKALSWRPFQNSDSSNASANESDGGGLLSNLRMPRLPLIGNGGDTGSDVEASATVPASTSSSQAPPRPTPAVATVTKPGSVPRISGAALVDGSSPVNARVESESEPTFAAAPERVRSSESMPDSEKEKSGGLFSMFKSSGSGSSGGGGFFGFGRKKPEEENGSIDASLFPTATNSEFAPGSRDYASAGDATEDTGAASSSSGQIEMPGRERERERSGGFSLPNIVKSERSGDSGSVPTSTTVNSAGTDYYVVSEKAQFMVHGESQMQSEVRALSAGTVVRMTRAGDQWASIRLPDGTEGVVRNKSLQAASAAEAGGQFASGY